MERLCTVVIIEPMTRLRRPGLDMFPYPLGPIADDAQAHLLFRDRAGLLDLREGLMKLLLRWECSVIFTSHR